MLQLASSAVVKSEHCPSKIKKTRTIFFLTILFIVVVEVLTKISQRIREREGMWGGAKG
jgi:hypothetical protein